MEEKKTYIDIMKELDSILPSTVYYDYTKILPDELWEKVYKLLENVGSLSRMSSSDLESLKIKIINIQNNIYGKTYYVRINSGENDMGFDQNHYFIKSNVINMKNMIFEAINNSYSSSYSSHFNSESYDEYMGTVDQIREYISVENVKNYIMNLLTITKEKNDNFNLNNFVERDILLHYNFGDIFSDSNSISRLIDDAVLKSANYKGELHSYGYEGVEHNSQRFNAEINAIIDKIVNLIIKNANNLLKERISIDDRKKAGRKAVSQGSRFSIDPEKDMFELFDEYHEDNHKLESLLGEDDLPKKENLNLFGENYDLPPVLDVDEKSLEEINLDDMMSNYNKMLEVINRNKEIIEEFKKLQSRMQDLKKEYDANNNYLGVTRGSK